jgi:hypothetical protein
VSRPEPTSEAEQPPSPLETWFAFALVLLLTVLLCLWAAFLVPLRVGTVRLPVSLLIAGVGNGLLGWAGGRLLGVPGVLVPGALWLGLAFLLGRRGAGGDLVIPGDLVGTAFLALGALGFAVAFGMTSARQTAATPGPPAGR